MIHKILKIGIILSLLIVVTPAFCQKKAATDSTKAKDTTTLSSLSDQLSELKQIIKNSTDTVQKVGILGLETNEPITVYVDNKEKLGRGAKKTGRKIKIDKAIILIKDGYILDIQAFSGRRIFTNPQAPIIISTRSFKNNNYLYNENNDDECILFRDILTYQSFNSFLPQDTLVVLDTAKNSITLTKNVGLNTVLDLRLYTDALSAFGKASNGIIQTDVLLKQSIRRGHFTNKGGGLFEYFKLSFNARKFDSKNSFVDSGDAIPRTQLIQKSKISAGLAINLFQTWVEKKSLSNFYIDLGGSIGITDLARSKDTEEIITQYLFLEGGFNFKFSSNIGFDFLDRIMVQYSPQTDFNSQNKAKWFDHIGGEVYWNPYNNTASRIFGRVNYIFGFNKSEKKNSFLQAQIGYSTLLSKLIGTK